MNSHTTIDERSGEIRKATAVGGMWAAANLLCLRILGALAHLVHDRGMQRCTWILARHVFAPSHKAILRMASGGLFKIRLTDGYWTRLLIPGYIYEPETWLVLRRSLEIPNAFFIDCGANIGYWSVLCSQFLPEKFVIAVEASPSTYQQLTENAQLNQNKFETVWCALWDRDGESAVIVEHEERHAGSSIVNRREKIGKTGYTEHAVSTLTIDSIVDRYVKDQESKIVIKLDVEGAEIQSLRGASRSLRERDVLLWYEDHGQDAQCRTSEFVLKDLGLLVLYFDERMRPHRMRSIEDVRGVKTDVHSGYNFVAFKFDSSFSRLFTGTGQVWVPVLQNEHTIG